MPHNYLNKLEECGDNRMRSSDVPAGHRDWQPYSFSLYGSDGDKKYLNVGERQRALAAMDELEPDERLFALTLAWSGARISEVLAVTPRNFQLETGVVAILTLKRRQSVWREIPLPPWVMRDLNLHFGLEAAQRDPASSGRRLWPCHRVTGWKIIKHAMMLSQNIGRAACPRGLRHSFGVGTLQSGVPLNQLQRWLGHSRISTTSIYATAAGPEEIALAARFWRTDPKAAEHVETTPCSFAHDNRMS